MSVISFEEVKNLASSAAEQPGWSGLAKFIGVVAKVIGRRSTGTLCGFQVGQTNEIEGFLLSRNPCKRPHGVLCGQQSA